MGVLEREALEEQRAVGQGTGHGRGMCWNVERGLFIDRVSEGQDGLVALEGALRPWQTPKVGTLPKVGTAPKVDTAQKQVSEQKQEAARNQGTGTEAGESTFAKPGGRKSPKQA